MYNKKEQEKLYVECDCGSETIVLAPQDPDCLECGLDLCVLANAYKYKASFWHRFRHIWYTLIHGLPYTDQVCLDLEKVKQLNKYLYDYINKVQPKRKNKGK